MALTDNPEKATNETQSTKREKPLTKVIIRRLPPTIDRETFINQVSPLPDYDYIYTVCGDSSLGENSFGRVYINFVNPEDVFTFKERFDNYVFVDAKGHEYPAVVEFAAFQRIPKKRNKQKGDPKCDTIETDPVYLEFLELLKQQPQQEEKPEYSLQLSTSEAKADITTPLLEYVKQRRLEKQRIREERREERKRREFERRKVRDDDRRKRFEDKSPIKTVIIKPNVSKKEKEGEEVKENKETSEKQEVVEKPPVYSSGFKNKEKKFEERKTFTTKGKYPSKAEKKDYYDKKAEFKSRREEYKNKYQEEFKKDEGKFTKKVKKYSERREERKNVAKQNEKKQEEDASESAKPLEEKKNDLDELASKPEANADEEENKEKEEPPKETCTGHSGKSKENDPRAQRRIRNKDRPTMQIYQPGMLSKRRQSENSNTDGSGDAKPCTETK